MFLGTILSEWTKLISTKAVYWTTGVMLALCLGYAALVGANTVDYADIGIAILYPQEVASGIAAFGFMIIAIQAIMIVTSEYRHNYQSATFTATPNRTLVVLAKWLIYALFAAVLVFLIVVASFYLAKIVAPGEAGATLRPFHDENALKIMWQYPLVCVLLVTFSQGLGYIIRQTAGTVTIVVALLVGLEAIIGFIPRVGKYVTEWGPFSHLNNWLGTSAIFGEEQKFTETQSAFYFAAWCVAIFIIGLVLVNRRDA
ncbi:ABC transporter [Corynebacterium kutscheri]|uniref:ABC transporter n=1 Tax=Corynebacterium kutscheri TaxID=35755 RepID=A0A0F6TE05_9CORY|nr:multidrug ABC transporter permease [Corynebacterium kutscheri]AKE42006.1 ABC-2 family transporter protein [Corynebacterium kutscheri]VEH06180.1 ABC transporter [Corynebacterium kutscheri]VEH10347.1 ABC transporter [Corynebacterium kutscheri]VEH82093.1 ABC transporter [Corynebacterium kutscheri]